MEVVEEGQVQDGDGFVTCPYCGEPMEPWQGYYLNGKIKEHERCHEDRIRRESREDFDKSTMVQKYVKERDQIKKK